MVLWARVLLGSRLFLINILPIIIMTIGLSYFFYRSLPPLEIFVYIKK